MDRTAALRRLKPTIEACQKGEVAMAKKQFGAAEPRFAEALRRTPDDYPANLLMAQCLQAQDKDGEALRYARQATRIYPQEAQGHKLAGVLALGLKDPAAAYDSLDRYDRLLPGEAGVTFLKGVSLEAQGRREAAARHYAAYVKRVNQGEAARHAQGRLRAWGYAK